MPPEIPRSTKQCMSSVCGKTRSNNLDFVEDGRKEQEELRGGLRNKLKCYNKGIVLIMLLLILRLVLPLGVVSPTKAVYEFGKHRFFKPQSGAVAHKRALVYTPYDFSPGGGEKYLLEVVAFLMKTGHQVVLLTHDTNYCQTIDCVLGTANKLRVDISADFTYLPLDYKDLVRAHVESHGVDIYWAMGNGRFPEFANPAHLGVYQCQFPFDLDGPYTDSQVTNLSTMQIAVVYSQYTSSWYTKFLAKPVNDMEAQGLPYPSVEILFPAVPDPTDGQNVILSPIKNNMVKVAQVGRIFTGRQNKGHIDAIKAIVSMNERAKLNGGPTYELHIIGNVQAGFESHKERLMELSAGESVIYHFGVSSDELKSLLKSCHVIWHLTGIDQTNPESDPASFEHFGISLVEGMLMGLQPVVINAGGLPEIVGTLGEKILNVEELIEKTEKVARELISMSTQDREENYLIMRKHVEKFSKENFELRLNRIIVRTMTSNMFQKKYLPLLPYTCLMSTFKKPKNGYIGTAFIYVHSLSWHAKMTVRNVIQYLGPGWQLCIAYPQQLDEFSHNLARSVMGQHYKEHVKMMPLDIDVSSTDSYSELLMSIKFWETLEYEHVLIFQTDSALLRNPVPFLSQSPQPYIPFLGAPWCKSNEIFYSNAVSTAIGNGGLSYRSNSFMQQCVKSDTVKTEINRRRARMQANGQAHFMMNEDLFFSVCLTTLYDQPTIAHMEELAESFAVEVPCQADSLTKAAGIHATWHYTPEASIARIVNRTRYEARKITNSHNIYSCSQSLTD